MNKADADLVTTPSKIARRESIRPSSVVPLMLFLALAWLPSVAAAKTIMVFGPHPDDETMIAAGRMRAALNSGASVKIVVVTNGDAGGVSVGLMREGESVAAAQVLGLTEQDVIFLGYPDGSMLDIYNAASPTQVFTSAAGQTSTYGNRGLGGMDYHSYRYGSPGPYNHATVSGDIQALLTTYMPDEIYTTGNFDTHPDHQATDLFVLLPVGWVDVEVESVLDGLALGHVRECQRGWHWAKVVLALRHHMGANCDNSVVLVLHLVVKDRAPESGETAGIGTVDRKLGELTGHVRTSQSSSGSAKATR